MKKYFAFIGTLILISCADQYMEDEMADGFSEQTPKTEIDALMDKAHWGDGQVCLKLADCYRDGIGVKPDFVRMINMVSLAEDYGAINRVEDYFECLPTDNELEILSKLAKNEADRDAIYGVMVIEKGDTLLGWQMIEAAAEQESSLAILLSCTSTNSGFRPEGIKKMVEVAEKVPYAYKMLGNIYSGKDYPGLKDEQLAAYYYLKADQHTCLGKDGARWLLRYYREGGDLKLNEKDLERLQILSKEEHQEPAVTSEWLEDVDEVIEIVDEDYIEEVEE